MASNYRNVNNYEQVIGSDYDWNGTVSFLIALFVLMLNMVIGIAVH